MIILNAIARWRRDSQRLDAIIKAREISAQTALNTLMAVSIDRRKKP